MNEINQQSMLRVGTLIHGGVYRVEDYLSSGGFGNTYVVRNVEFDEVYALKEFYIKGVCQRDEDSTTISVSNAENTECFTQQREKFKKEARRIRGLHNEHIVKVYDLFEENGTAYYVMDLVDGESLKDLLHRTNKPLTEAEVNDLLPQILDGLKAIHDQGIWHLDIKPANIMVDKNGTVKLIDFGASKQQSSVGGATTSTGISYTMGYAPGEQMAQEYEEFGPWTDFYALGATLYKLLTLQNPPSVTKVSDDETGDKREALPMTRVSNKTKRLIAWMMQNKRKCRPQNAAEILARLEECDDNTSYCRTGIDDSDGTLIAEQKPKVTQKPINEKSKVFQKTIDEITNAPTSLEPISQTPPGEENSNPRLRKALYAVIVSVVAGVVWGVMANSNKQQDTRTTKSHQETHNTVNLERTITQDAPKNSNITDQKVCAVVEQMPGFPGGTSALMSFLSTSLKYPCYAQENGIEGCVIISFVVEVDGSISNVKVVRSVDHFLDSEAIRVVKSMPKWIPGKQNGVAVRVKLIVPINFKLE